MSATFSDGPVAALIDGIRLSRNFLCRYRSFLPGTLVLMADGTFKAIELVEVGDWVEATDPETGEEGPREVVDVIEGDGDKDLVEITVDGQTITATDNHPFWVPELHEWVEAGDLKVGQRLYVGAGTTILIVALNAYTANQVSKNESTLVNV